MKTITSYRHCGQTRLTGGLLWLAAIAGLVLSIMDLLEICTEACSETAKFTIFSFNFGWFGLAFFTAVLASLAARRWFPVAGLLMLLLLFGAAGAELYFIWLQKYEIGKWCPICLTIAGTVYLGCGVLLYETLRSETVKNKFKRIAVMVVALIVGTITATFGVVRESQAALDFFLGKAKSPVTVYFISDWFCPVCQKVEPRIEQIYAHVAREARVAFIDYPIHAETNNFTPYNLQFLAFEKEKYPKLRSALAELAKKTKTPTPEQVQAAVAPHGVTLRQMNYADILYGLQANLTTYRGFGVTATPSVVIANAKTKKHNVLIGDRQITLPAIQAALSEIGR